MANNFIHGFVILNEVTFTEEQREQFNQIKSSYFIEFEELSTINNRTLYYLAMRDRNKLNDSIDEGNTTYGVLTLFAPRNPDVIGVWEMDGCLLGQTKKITPAVYNDEELVSEEVIEIIGEPLYPFKKDKYIPFMSDIVTYDEEGNELSRTKPTKAVPLRVFGGFKSPIMD